jgi:hypothetical protein
MNGGLGADFITGRAAAPGEGAESFSRRPA